MTNIQNKKQFAIYIALIVAILAVFNIVSRTLFFRLDLTRNGMYSLSNSSKRIIEKIDDRMVAKIFFSKDLPGQYASSRRYLQDLLEEYQAYASGEFHFEFINPDDSKESQTEAQGYGIPPVQLQVVENDKLEIKNVYMGMVLLYNDKKETIPVIQTTEGLEYDITMAIKKVSETDMKKVGIISPEVEGLTTDKLRQLLQQTYTVRSLSPDKEIPPEIGTVIMNGWQDSLTTDALYNLDQYLLRGGRLFIGQGRLNANLQEGLASEIQSNIFDLLENYGFRIGKDMIIDRDCGQIQVQQRHGFFNFANAVSYPAFPLIHRFNNENMIVKNLEQVRLFFVNEISPTDSSVHFTPLMSSSKNTGSIASGMVPRQSMTGNYSMVQGYNIMPHINNSQMQNPAMLSFPLKSKTLAALVTGERSSYFANDPVYSKKENFRSRGEVEIILLTDNEFFSDQRGGGIPENTDLILNSVDYLSGDQELVEIRSREVTARPLAQLADGSRHFWKWLNIVLPALLVILLGLLRWRRNSDKRKLLEEIYG